MSAAVPTTQLIDSTHKVDTIEIQQQPDLSPPSGEQVRDAILAGGGSLMTMVVYSTDV